MDIAPETSYYVVPSESLTLPASYSPTVSSSDSSFFSWEATVARLTRIDFIVVYLALLTLAILLFLVVFYGESTPFYQGLVQPDINPWIPRIMWVVATILSYVTFFFIWQDVRVHPNPQDLRVSVLFMISSFIFLAWALALYYGQNHVLAIWLAIVLFIYNYWIFIYVWGLSTIGALFLIPNLLLYAYLVYASVNLASLNNAPI